MLAFQTVELPFIRSVVNTPVSVAIIALVLSPGKNIQPLTGISGNVPSMAVQLVPPLATKGPATKV